MEKLESTQREIHHHYGSCCWPYGGRINLFCGVILVLVGVVWLLTGLGLVPDSWWKLIGPAILILWGGGILFFRGEASTGSRAEPR